jgi:hypothetical protein
MQLKFLMMGPSPYRATAERKRPRIPGHTQPLQSESAAREPWERGAQFWCQMWDLIRVTEGAANEQAYESTLKLHWNWVMLSYWYVPSARFLVGFVFQTEPPICVCLRRFSWSMLNMMTLTVLIWDLWTWQLKTSVTLVKVQFTVINLVQCWGSSNTSAQHLSHSHNSLEQWMWESNSWLYVFINEHC